MLERNFLGLTLGLLVILGMQGSAGPVPPRGLVGDFAWTGTGALFGGFSALHLTPDGAGFVALSDHGAWVEGQFQRDAGGSIIGVTNGTVTPLMGRTGKPLVGGRTDSEGLAIAADGTVFVSFEGPARVLRYAHLGGNAENLPDAPDFARMEHNSALEALAIAPDGTLYTLPERSGALMRPFPVYRFRGGVWDQPTAIPREGGFLVADASIGPDGRFYVLEREFLGLAGFATRLRRFNFAGDALTGEKLLLQTQPGLHDNLEGLSVWRDPQGRLRATMVSDNNYLFIFRSEIVEYRLPD